MKLTIVLTIYNKESYLGRALDALLNQESVGNDDYEVLAVNDGSTDGSASIIDEYKEKDPRIRVLTQENQGLSMARNNGVKAALGEYVWFVDSDDTIDPQAVSAICEAIDKSPDIIPIYAKTNDEAGIRNAVNPNVKSGRDILVEGKWEHCGVFNIIRKDFLIQNNLSFIPGIYHEDAEFTPRLLYYATKVVVVPKVLYIVYRDPNSITQVPKAKRSFDYLTVVESLYHFVVEKGERKTILGNRLFTNIAVIINMAFYIIVQNEDEDQKRYNQVYYKKRKIFNDILSLAEGKKYKIESLLFRLVPCQYVKIYKFLKLFG